MKVALAYGYWGQNIGNAFFQLGGQALLERALGPESVTLIQDVPAHWTLNRKSRGNPSRWWDVVSNIEADYVIFQGPSLDQHSLAAYDQTFGRLVDRGVEPVLLSIGLMQYTDDEVRSARELIERHKIRTVVTRDRHTAEALRPHVTHDGIDSGFFLPWATTPPSLAANPYVAVAFERILEPVTDIESVVRGEALDPSRARGSGTRRLVDHAARRSHIAAYAAQALWPARLSSHYGGLEAVRLVHRTNPAHMARIFRHPNTVASDEPYTYCSIYAGAELTLTDRVHACVATLAYGGPAMLWLDTPRASLLERVGLELPMLEPARVSPQELERERLTMVDVVRERIY